MQNRSHAVMAQRIADRTGLDDFPSPPWATRALVRHVLEPGSEAKNQTVLEPACGRGHMATTLAEYFGSVHAADIHPYGHGIVEDFLASQYAPGSFDWVITNPPFKIAEDFIDQALPIARKGVALLERTVFIEGVGRFNRLYKRRPPSIIGQFTERVPMHQGRLEPKGSTATAYAWFVWLKDGAAGTQMVWIPPCRKVLQDDDDYLPEFLARGNRTPSGGANGRHH